MSDVAQTGSEAGPVIARFDFGDGQIRIHLDGGIAMEVNGNVEMRTIQGWHELTRLRSQPTSEEVRAVMNDCVQGGQRLFPHDQQMSARVHFAADLIESLARSEAAHKADAERLYLMVDAQAEDAGLWFVAQTAPEVYLQANLRRLHAAIDAARGK